MLHTECPWMIEGAVRTTQSVTPQWAPIQGDFIPGVKVFEPKNVMTGYGRLVEVYREDWGLDDEPVKQVFQATFNPGEGSAWHAHGETRDRLFVNSGAIRIILYNKVSGAMNVFTFGEHRPGFVIIPKGIWHGVVNVGPRESSLLNLVSNAYSYTQPDHWRLPADTDKIPCDGFRRALRLNLLSAQNDPFET